MNLVLWIVLAGAAITGAAMAAFSAGSWRIRAGSAGAVGATGVLLMGLQADLLAVAWLLLAMPLALAAPPGASVMRVDPPGAGRRLAGCVLAGVLFGALDLVVQRTDWGGLPAEGFRAQTAEVAGRMLASDLVLLGGLMLAVVVLVCRPARIETEGAR